MRPHARLTSRRVSPTRAMLDFSAHFGLISLFIAIVIVLPTTECSLLHLFQSPTRMGDYSTTDSITFNKVLSIPCEKLIGTTNYTVKLWFQGQGLEDHLTKQLKDIANVYCTKWKKIDVSLCTVSWFSISLNFQVQYQAFTSCYEVRKKG